ncbi:hypothetical protein, partial [Shewanella sp.]|uniref:hypothetical protein n=1 Tax=Shewanella sp. TaxID=50422 RepID=UPI003D0C6D01
AKLHVFNSEAHSQAGSTRISGRIILQLCKSMNQITLLEVRNYRDFLGRSANYPSHKTNEIRQ